MAYKILKGRKLMFMLKTPFDTVLEANKCPNLLREMDYVRTCLAKL